MPSGIKPSSAPSSGYYVSGLWLHNALWDTSRSVLKAVTTDDKQSCSMPVLWIKPVHSSSDDKQPIKYKHYSCPLYMCENADSLRQENIVTFVNLPSFEAPSVWESRSVYISSRLDS